MTDLSTTRNLQIYNAPEVVAHYAALNYLTACERLLFQTYIPRGSTVLDLGVGGGRTTPYLAKLSLRYVGVDYSPAMVESCRRKFPELEFMVADGSDLSEFPDASFDAVVFAFNGIDYVLPDDSRQQCFEHIRRILRPGAVVIFSSHNPRSVLVRGGWNGRRLRQMAQRFSRDSNVLEALLMALLVSARSMLSCVQSGWATLERVRARMLSPVFWSGEGNLADSAHGGLLTHYATPNRVIAQLTALGLRVERVLGDDYPQRSRPYVTDWYYYVFTKPCEK